MMRLRELGNQDAPFMLEWMHDKDVVKNLRADFELKTIDDCKAFIKNARDFRDSLHLAIVNDNNEYMGTVSLKHITKKNAEFGITVRSCAMGKGFSGFGMKAIIDLGFKELGLQEIYWCVDPENKRALKFYDKQNYMACNAPSFAKYTDEEKKKYLWFHILAAGDYYKC